MKKNKNKKNKVLCIKKNKQMRKEIEKSNAKELFEKINTQN